MNDEDVEDVKTIVDFIVGWWPGLEDNISWPNDENHPVYLAAHRLKGKLK